MRRTEVATVDSIHQPLTPFNNHPSKHNPHGNPAIYPTILFSEITAYKRIATKFFPFLNGKI